MIDAWATRILEEVCEIGDGNHSGNYPKSTEMVAEGIPFIRGTNLIKGKISSDNIRYITPEKHEILKKGHLKTGDILFTNRGMVGKKAIVDDRFDGSNLNSQIAWFRCKENINNRFLYYQLESPSLLKTIFENTNGTALQQLTVRQIKKLKIVIPTLEEQKKIVAILDQAFAAIDQAQANIQQNIQNAQDLFQSKLNQIFSQQGDGWEEKLLGDISFVKSGGTPLKSVYEYWDNGKIPWYSSGELNNLYTMPSKAFITDTGLENSNAKLFPKGSLLIGMYDTAALKMSILDREGTFNQAISGVEPKDDLSLEFIFHSINSIKPRLLKERRGVRQKNLSLRKIKEIPINLPNLETQNQVVLELGKFKVANEGLIDSYKLKLINLEELKKSLLQKAFNGELTQTQRAA